MRRSWQGQKQMLKIIPRESKDQRVYFGCWRTTSWKSGFWNVWQSVYRGWTEITWSVVAQVQCWVLCVIMIFILLQLEQSVKVKTNFFGVLFGKNKLQFPDLNSLLSSVIYHLKLSFCVWLSVGQNKTFKETGLDNLFDLTYSLTLTYQNKSWIDSIRNTEHDH